MAGEMIFFNEKITKTLLYVLVLISFSIYYLISKVRRDPRLIKFSKTIPGPDGLPLIGNTLQFVFSGLDGISQILHEYSKNYGRIYKLWLGNELVVGLSNTEYLEAVFQSSKTLSKSKILFRGYKELFGNSLFTASVPIWRKTRKRLIPVFAKNVMKFQISSLNDYVDEYLDQMVDHLNGPEFNIKKYMQNLVMDSFLGSYYNVHLTPEEKKYFKFDEIFDSCAAYASAKMFFPWLRSNLISKMYFGNMTTKLEKRLREFFSKIKLPESVALIEKKNEKNVNAENISTSFLKIMRQQEAEMEIQDYVYNEATNFVIAVSGTTATALSFCLLAIAMHSDVQKKLFDEISTVFGDDNGPIDMNDLDKLEYLDRVIKETQRRFTVLKTIFKEVQEDIKIGSMMIPAKTIIMVRIGDVHMDPDSYPNPQLFNPENFSPQVASQRSKYSYLPLSMGIRDCIGKHWAESIIKLTTVKFLRRFHLNTSVRMEDINAVGTFADKARGGYWISTELRK